MMVSSVIYALFSRRRTAPKAFLLAASATFCMIAIFLSVAVASPRKEAALAVARAPAMVSMENFIVD